MVDYYSWGSLVFVALMFYVLIINPHIKRNRQLREMISALKVGDEIITIGGIIGTVTAIEEGTITLSSGNKDSLIKIESEALRNVVK